MQGAVASHAYDSTAPFRVIPTSRDDGTPDRYINYYTTGAPCYFSGVGAARSYINYFNTNDFVLTNRWRSDQDNKPASGYHWNGTSFSKGLFWPYTLLVFPSDTYEIFSYCDEARSEAIGAQPNLGGPFRIPKQMDLGAFPYSFDNREHNHSAQFLWNTAVDPMWKFWDAALKSMGLKQ